MLSKYCKTFSITAALSVQNFTARDLQSPSYRPKKKVDPGVIEKTVWYYDFDDPAREASSLFHELSCVLISITVSPNLIIAELVTTALSNATSATRVVSHIMWYGIMWYFLSSGAQKIKFLSQWQTIDSFVLAVMCVLFTKIYYLHWNCCIRCIIYAWLRYIAV